MSSASLTAEKLFPLLLESLHDYALFMMDGHGVIVAWTPGVQRVLGFEEADFVGQRAHLIFTPEDIAAGVPEAELGRAAETGRSDDIRWHLRKDGSRVWVNGQMMGLFDEEGQLQGFAKLLRDDTARKAMEDELHDARTRFQTALAGGSVATWDFDIHNNRVFADKNLASLFGVSEEDANGGPLEQYVRSIHPDDIEAVSARISRVIETGDAYEAEYRVVRPDGSVRWLSTRGKPDRDENGVSYRLTGVALDITARREAEEALAEAHQKAKQANRIKDEFLATLSHELRTPLNAILGWANVLRTSDLDSETLLSGLETIERNARSQAQLIEDLLDVSRILIGKLRLEMHAVELAPLVEDAVKNAMPTAHTKHIRLISQIDHSEGVIFGDPDRISQILWNLLSNAIKFTPTNGKVMVQLDVAEPWVQVRISDNGLGIDPEFLPHVFERFRQADASTTRTTGGLGIGLGLVSSLVEAHGGTVQVESEGLGKGSAFTVWFPLAAANTEAAWVSRPELETRLRKPAFEDISLPSLAGIRILTADDDPDARALTVMCLTKRGATVISAANAAEAFAQVVRSRNENRPFHLLISDIGMPGEDGFGLVRRIRKLEAESGSFLPAIAQTAFAGETDRVNIFAAGFQLHIAKPVNPVELVASAASLVGLTGRD